MNLLLGTDAKATARKLDEYEIAMGIKPRPAEEAGRGPRAVQSKNDGEADPTGLIKGLKKIVIPAPKAVYDPFMGMPKKRGYYDLRSSYETRYDKLKTDPGFDPAGYNFQQYMDESLLRAFSGLGVFIEDELAGHGRSNTTTGPGPVAVKDEDPF